MDNTHHDHRERIRQEFLKHGVEHFEDHKLLEFLLFYVIPQKDTNPLAHRLIDRFGSFSNVFTAPYDLLKEVKGSGEKTAIYLKLLGEFVQRYMVDTYSTKKMICSTEDAKQYMQYRFLNDTIEQIILVCLGSGEKIIYSDTIATGTLEQVNLVPVDIIKQCLRVNAVKAILAHNHPGGLCLPSRADISSTMILRDELNRVGIELTDHIIVASDGIYSMKENDVFSKYKYR